MKAPNGLEALEEELMLLGYEPDSPGYDLALTTKKVERCKQVKEVLDCRADCSAFDHCETIKTYLIHLRYTPQGLLRKKDPAK